MGFKYSWLKPTVVTTIVNTTNVEENKRTIYVGGFAGVNTTGMNFALGVEGSFVTKQKTMYDVRYDLFGKTIMVGISRKLTIKI